jgi:hypothetical protein
VATGRIPRIAYHHPLLDARHGVDPRDDACVLTDADVERLIDAYLAAAKDAEAAGFDMVDLKACHGYLVHEFLSARRRPGRWGGDFAGRTRLLTTLIERVKAECPRLLIGVRLSLFDMVPWHMVNGHGEPFSFEGSLPYDCGFGVDEANPLTYDLAEPIALLKVLRDLGVCAVNLTAGFPLTAADLGPAGDATAYAVFDAFNVGAGPLAVLPVPGAGETYTIPVGQGQPSAPARALPIRYLHVVPRHHQRQRPHELIEPLLRAAAGDEADRLSPATREPPRREIWWLGRKRREIDPVRDDIDPLRRHAKPTSHEAGVEAIEGHEAIDVGRPLAEQVAEA